MSDPRPMHCAVLAVGGALLLGLASGALSCGPTKVINHPSSDAGNTTGGPHFTVPDSGAPDGGEGSSDAGPADAGHPDSGSTAPDAGPDDAGIADAGAPDAGVTAADVCTVSDGGDAASCYAIVCTAGLHTLQANRDRLILDLATRKCTDRCTLWAALSQGERYIFLMDTAYFGAPSSLLYPLGSVNMETALDHAVALYTINAPMAGQGVDFSGRGGLDYNRIYLGFDDLAKCVMRHSQDNPNPANPTQDPSGNQWVKSDDLAGPHAPFTQREMIYWYKAWYDLQSEGPQFHHWHQDSDFSQAGINQRLGVCGVSDPSLVESTIAFDAYHSSDPLGDYSGRGGYGWQIVSQYVGLDPDWSYMPTGCPVTQPVNTDPYGGGTFAGMGPSLDGGVCLAPTLGPIGSCLLGP